MSVDDNLIYWRSQSKNPRQINSNQKRAKKDYILLRLNGSLNSHLRVPVLVVLWLANIISRTSVTHKCLIITSSASLDMSDLCARGDRSFLVSRFQVTNTLTWPVSSVQSTKGKILKEVENGTQRHDLKNGYRSILKMNCTWSWSSYLRMSRKCLSSEVHSSRRLRRRTEAEVSDWLIWMVHQRNIEWIAAEEALKHSLKMVFYLIPLLWSITTLNAHSDTDRWINGEIN